MSTLRWSRRSFLVDGTALAAGASWLALGDGVALSQMTGADAGSKPDSGLDGFPRQSPRLIEEVVGASHGKFDRVKELVLAYPEVAKSSWDWGFGDWESPIDAASHVGNREIALFLIEQGARPTLFTFAMLGMLDAVKALISAQPAQRKMVGPHGFNLMHHAKVGGDAAAAVKEYFIEIGEKEAESAKIPQETIDALIGKYKTEGESPAEFEMLTNRFGLAVQGAGGIPRSMTALPDGTMHPAGAPSVRFQFQLSSGKAATATVQMGGRKLTAVRIG